MKKIFIIIMLAVAGALGARAQEPEKDFYVDTRDVSAQKYSRVDLHGEKCALLKVRVVAQGVTFSGNVMGDVEKRGSEYWVYIPGGTKMLHINADTFLPFMFDFPEPLQGGLTYVLTLKTPQAAGGGQPASSANYLVLKVSPATARVIVDGKERAVNNGAATVRLEKGTHSYRVEALGYAPQDGSVLMSGQRVTRSVELISTISTLTVTAANPGTEIYVNDSRKGVDRWSGQLVPDTYTVEGRLAGHRPYTRSVTLAESGSQTVDIPALVAITGTLNVEYTPLDATITIDGRAAGVTPNVFNDLTVGTHTVTISAPGYTPATHTITLTESSPSTLTGALTPAPAASTLSPSTTTSSDPYAADIALTSEYESFKDPSSGKYGFKHDDSVVIPAKYDYAEDFSEGLALVKINGKYGFIDKTGSLVIPAIFGYATKFHEGIAGVTVHYSVGGLIINRKLGIIDKTGTLTIIDECVVLHNFHNGRAMVQLSNDKYGFIDKTGALVIPAIYDDAFDFSDGLAYVKTNGKYGFVDKNGTFVIPAKYDYVYQFSGGLANVRIKGKWGLIDTDGSLVIPTKYNYYDFGKVSEGLAGLKIKGKWGYFDKTGAMVIPAIYEWVTPFENGKAKVKLNGREFYIDRNGNEVQ